MWYMLKHSEYMHKYFVFYSKYNFDVIYIILIQSHLYLFHPPLFLDIRFYLQQILTIKSLKIIKIIDILTQMKKFVIIENVLNPMNEA